jgi:DNA-binding MarR family transcriptional regulator
MTNGRIDVSHRDVLIALRRIIRAHDLHSRALIQRFGLTGPQLIILHELSRLGEVPAGELARAINLSQPTVTGILKRLELKGLVRRRRDETDRRVVRIAVTAACDTLLRAAPPALRESFTRAFDRLVDWEQHLIISSLERVASMMEATPLDGPTSVASHATDHFEDQTPLSQRPDRHSSTTPSMDRPVKPASPAA